MKEARKEWGLGAGIGMNEGGKVGCVSGKGGSGGAGAEEQVTSY
jgi:hypothetical protein